ncbi:aldo/keto reductase [Metabacillus fastidiosus]|uniref:Aldo/keto reductase n=1 Tax=Metabacillus fastidiosus TaxID=1458 RepID=A0ABU6NXU1_9BACI|nr:aldo/keto reductase [Metabacillus fastidiosus]MED4401952.1 aldo/keto reductase [Metabacillus fastidiosus]MED4460915.1 aldo/keto reductase [Metabacillus fastidiosus]
MSLLNDAKIADIRSSLEKRVITLPDGTTVPVLGQGTWYMGENARTKDQEVKALQLGIELGMTLIDTAEMYGGGGSERVVGEAIKGRRDDVFLVSKFYPSNASISKVAAACENSLKRLGTDHLDLYLLHWRGSVPFEETIEGLEKLKKEGKILRWGVSNLDTEDMDELYNAPNGQNCMTNQVLYHLGSRGIDFDLLPWQRERRMPIMAYCPIAQGGSLRRQLLNNPIIQDIAEKHGVQPLQIVLAWCIRSNDVIAIPKASQEEHVIQNASVAAIELTSEDLKRLDQAFPPPTRKTYLDIV